MKLEDLAATLDLLRSKGVRKATIADDAALEVEFFGDASSPADATATPGEQADFERELDERTAGYDEALAQIARRSFKQGAS